MMSNVLKNQPLQNMRDICPMFHNTSHEFVVRFKQKLIEEVINKNITVTVMVLHPDSPEVKHKEFLFKISNLAKIIREQLVSKTVDELVTSIR